MKASERSSKRVLRRAIGFLPYEFLRLVAFFLVLYALGLVSHSGINGMLLFAAQSVLAGIVSVFRALNDAGGPVVGHETGSVSLWRYGLIAVGLFPLGWIVLFVMESISRSTVGHANFPVTNLVGVISVAALAVTTSMWLGIVQARVARDRKRRIE